MQVTTRHLFSTNFRPHLIADRLYRPLSLVSLTHPPLSAYLKLTVFARPLISAFHSTATMGEDEWKLRAPYRIHEEDDGFQTRYEASCHCGRVKYQLSREKPLDAKYCHCTTCQTLHGWSGKFYLIPAINLLRRSLPMGSNFP